MRVSKKISQKRAPSECATEAPAANSPNQEHHQDDSTQDFESYDDFIVGNPVNKNEENVLERERDNCTLWIKHPV